jgi:hypothetical protein
MPIRTGEVYDTAQYLPFDRVIVHKGEKQFLESAKFPGEITERGGDMWKAIEEASSAELKRGLGVEKPIIGIVFDKMAEAQCRILLNGLIERGATATHHIAVFAIDNRSRKLILQCLKPYLQVINIYGNEVIKACDRIYACRWTDYLEPFNWNLEIIDFMDKERTLALAPEGVKVHETIPVD